MVMARSARMGTKTFAVAVLLQRLVMITARPVKMRLATHPGNEDKFILTIKLRIFPQEYFYPLLGQLSHEHEGET